MEGGSGGRASSYLNKKGLFFLEEALFVLTDKIYSLF
jgi:hypothetical protein